MRNTIILGTLLALFGLASIAQASDRPKLIDRDTAQVTREASGDSRGEQPDQNEQRDRSRQGHDEAGEQPDRR